MNYSAHEMPSNQIFSINRCGIYQLQTKNLDFDNK